MSSYLTAASKQAGDVAITLAESAKSAKRTLDLTETIVLDLFVVSGEAIPIGDDCRTGERKISML